MSLTELRRRIDRIDRELIALLNRRAALAVEIGEEKARRGVPVRDAEREADVLARANKANRGPLAGEAVEGIFRRIIHACRKLEQSGRGPVRARGGK